jgi:hypothetical protein
MEPSLLQNHKKIIKNSFDSIFRSYYSNYFNLSDLLLENNYFDKFIPGHLHVLNCNFFKAQYEILKGKNSDYILVVRILSDRSIKCTFNNNSFKLDFIKFSSIRLIIAGKEIFNKQQTLKLNFIQILVKDDINLILLLKDFITDSIEVYGHFTTVDMNQIQVRSYILFNPLTVNSLNIAKVLSKSIYIGNNIHKQYNAVIENIQIKDSSDIQAILIWDIGIDESVFCSLNNISILYFDSISSGNLEVSESSFKEIRFLNLTNKLADLSTIRLNYVNVSKNLIFGRILFENSKDGHVLYYENNLNWDTIQFFNCDFAYSMFKCVIPEYEEYSEEFNFKLLLDLKRHFGKLDHTDQKRLLEAYEKRFYLEYHRKKSFSLWLGYLSNNFGLSWPQPLIILLGLIILEYFLLAVFSAQHWDYLFEYWGTMFHLMNPAHKTDVLFVGFKANDLEVPKWIYNNYYIIDNIFRILIAYMIFQFIAAFRYRFNLK